MQIVRRDSHALTHLVHAVDEVLLLLGQHHQRLEALYLGGVRGKERRGNEVEVRGGLLELLQRLAKTVEGR